MNKIGNRDVTRKGSGKVGKPKENYTVDGGNGIALTVKVVHREVKELISVTDSPMVNFLNSGSVYPEIKRPAKKVKAKICCYDERRGKNRLMIKTLSQIVMDFNGLNIPEGYVCHHANYFRDNRLASIQCVEHAQNGRLKARFNNDHDFSTYVAHDLFNMTDDELLNSFIYAKLQEAGIL